MQAGQASRTTRFEPLPDGSVRRTVTLANGSVQSQEVLSGAAQSLLKLVSRHPHLLAELT